jgi:hypothetical protein
MINLNSIKKDLYKSKVNAKFSHYAGGKLFYNVELSDGRIYQFPINTTEVSHETFLAEDVGLEFNYKSIALASDLGNTAFSSEMKASELNRWIGKAIEACDFICINKAPEMV